MSGDRERISCVVVFWRVLHPSSKPSPRCDRRSCLQSLDCNAQAQPLGLGSVVDRRSRHAPPEPSEDVGRSTSESNLNALRNRRTVTFGTFASSGGSTNTSSVFGVCMIVTLKPACTLGPVWSRGCAPANGALRADVRFLVEFPCFRELLLFDFRQVQHVEPLRETVRLDERLSHGDAAAHKSQRRSKISFAAAFLLKHCRHRHVLTVGDVDRLRFLGFHLALRVRFDSVGGPRKV